MGFFDKLKKITTNLFSGFSEADEAFFEELEETLILADLGMNTALEAVEQLRHRARKEKLRDQEAVKSALREILAEMISVGDASLDLSTTPSVVPRLILKFTPSTAWSWLFAPTLKYFLRFFASIKTFSSIVISSRLRCWTAADQTGSSG